MDLDSSQQTKQEHTEAKRRILACAWATATAAPTATDRDDLDIDAFAPPPPSFFLSPSLLLSDLRCLFCCRCTTTIAMAIPDSPNWVLSDTYVGVYYELLVHH